MNKDVHEAYEGREELMYQNSNISYTTLHEITIILRSL